jgi:hypothetical protein
MARPANTNLALARLATNSVSGGLSLRYCMGFSVVTGTKIAITDLVLPQVNVVHVDKRYYITILVGVQGNAYLVEYELNIEARGLIVEFVIHYDLVVTR